MEHRPLSDPEFEQPWYKYAWLSDVDSESGFSYSLKNLRDNTLFFQSPKNFNDPYDCKVIINPCTKEVREAAHRKIIEEDMPDAPLSVKEKVLAERMAKKSLEQAYNDYKYNRERKFERFGVYCLTPYPTDMLMWAHYGEKHSGICFQIDVRLCWLILGERKIKKDIGFVNYVDEIPKIIMAESWLSEEENSALKEVQEIVFSKWEKWQDEDEIRVVIGKVEQQVGTRLIKFPEGIYKSVILGTNTKPEFITQVKTILREKENQIPLYKVTPKENEYLLELKLVEY